MVNISITGLNSISLSKSCYTNEQSCFRNMVLTSDSIMLERERYQWDWKERELKTMFKDDTLFIPIKVALLGLSQCPSLAELAHFLLAHHKHASMKITCRYSLWDLLLCMWTNVCMWTKTVLCVMLRKKSIIFQFTALYFGTIMYGKKCFWVSGCHLMQFQLWPLCQNVLKVQLCPLGFGLNSYVLCWLFKINRHPVTL